MGALELVNLPSLMADTLGSSEIVVGLIDGPVLTTHPDLAEAKIAALNFTSPESLPDSKGHAARHATAVAGVLAARRDGPAPGICPGCSFVSYAIFTEEPEAAGPPSATTHALASAINRCLSSGARVINLSVSLPPSTLDDAGLRSTLNKAAARDVLIVAAAGNDGRTGSSIITRHPWVIPVSSYKLDGAPSQYSNFAMSSSRRGIGAPGEEIGCIGDDADLLLLSGTSIAAPFVTGAAALLWSIFPGAKASGIRMALSRECDRRRSLVPPLLNAAAARQTLREHCLEKGSTRLFSS